MADYSDYSSSDTEEVSTFTDIETIHNKEDLQYNLINELLNSINNFRQKENPLILDKMTPIIFHTFIENLHPSID